MLKTIATKDGLATLYFDHDELDLWVDFHRDATTETTAEVILASSMEGCCLVDPDDCSAEHLPNGIVRYFMAYLPGKEPAECH